MSSSRSAYLDNAKAILITLVVFGHTMGAFMGGDPVLRAAHRTILVFHMPAFVFVSGYLSKPDAFTKKGSRTLLTLFWAYLFFNVINHVGSAYFQGADLDPVRFITAPSYALWFLLSLFWWRLLLPLFAPGERPVHGILAVSSAVVLAVSSGYLIEEGWFLSISRTFAFLPFFVAGYRVKKHGWMAPRLWWTRTAAVLAFLGVFGALYLGDFIHDDGLLYRSKSFAQMGDVTWWAGAVMLIVMAASFVLTFAFLQLVPERRMPFTHLGVTTISVYAWHALTLRVIRHLELDPLLIGTWYGAVATTLAMVIAFGWGPVPRVTLWITSFGRKKG